MVFSNNLLLGAGGQSTGQAPFDPTVIGNSVWLDGSADTLANTFSSGSAQTKVVISAWVQRNSFGSVQDIFSATGGTGGATRNNRFSFQADDTIDIQVETTALATIIYSTTRVFRDIGWYHVLVSIDQGSITSDQTRLYINGEQVDITVTAGAGTFTAAMSSFGNAALHNVGSNGGTGTFLNGYQTQTTMLVGQSIQNGDVGVTDFLDSFTYGTNGSQFAPKKDSNVAALASTAGGNSFCLDFSNSGSLGLDSSTLGNNFTATSMDSTNQSTSTPSLTFSTYNILDANAAYTSVNDGGNTFVVTNVGGAGMRTTLPMASGKWYWEQRNTYNEAGPAISAGSGFVNLATNSIIGEGSGSHSCYLNYLGLVRINASTGSSIGVTNGSTAVMGVAFDADTGKVWFRDSSGFGTSGDPANGTGEHATLATTSAPFFIASYVGGAIPEPFLNAGGNPTFNGLETAGGNADENGRGNFKLGAVPTGFLSLNTANLSAPDYQGIDYFAPTLYEGNGTGQRVGDFVPFTDAFNVANSAMFQRTEARALSRTAGTPSSSGGKKGTWSTWYKTANIDDDHVFFDTGTTATNRFSLQMDISGQISFIYGSTTILMTNADLKGGGLWRNLVLKVDTSIGSPASARAIMYIDGVEVTSFATDARASLTQDGELGYMDSGATQFVGSYNGSSAHQWDGYLAETIFLDNQFLSADSFGQLDTSTNKWVPKDISGLTLGDQGFYLAYGGNFGTGNGAGDSTGNSNNLTEIGTWATSDQFIDTPSQNFDNLGGASSGSPTISEGNTLATIAAGGKQIRSNFNLSSGKWYVEVDVQATNNSASMGLVPSRSATWANGPGRDANGGISYETDGDVYSDNVQDATAEASFAAGDVIQMAIDMNVKKVWFGKNNTFGGNPSAGTGGYFLPGSILSDGAALITLGGYSGSQAATMQINYGQFLVFDGGSTTNGFKYAPPTNFNAVNQDNLDDTQSKITAWAWIKNRDATDNHMLFDRVRGVGNDWHSNNAAAEVFNANTVQRFLQRGVQIGSDLEVNTASESYVLWQWLVGDSATTGSTTSPAGSNPSTTIVADHGGFSIGTYTGTGAGATVGHGLSSTPELILIKGQNYAVECLVWSEYTKSTTRAGDGFGFLASTNAFFDNGPNSYFADTDPNATVITMNGSTFNTLAKTYNLICLKSVAGVCKVGSYIGNSSDDGPYLSLGFKPSYWMVKCSSFSDASHDWFVADSARYIFNGTTTAGGLNGGTLEANDTTAEEAHNTNFGDNPAFDFLSEGIKLRSNSGTINGTGRTYLYFAMADIGGNGTLPPVYGR
jgi:hypothetical protein